MWNRCSCPLINGNVWCDAFKRFFMFVFMKMMEFLPVAKLMASHSHFRMLTGEMTLFFGFFFCKINIFLFMLSSSLFLMLRVINNLFVYDTQRPTSFHQYLIIEHIFDSQIRFTYFQRDCLFIQVELAKFEVHLDGQNYLNLWFINEFKTTRSKN